MGVAGFMEQLVGRVRVVATGDDVLGTVEPVANMGR
jgi:hypothetical protein